jgi:hypothetical protein
MARLEKDTGPMGRPRRGHLVDGARGRYLSTGRVRAITRTAPSD